MLRCRGRGCRELARARASKAGPTTTTTQNVNTRISSRKLCTHLVSNALYARPLLITLYHYTRGRMPNQRICHPSASTPPCRSLILRKPGYQCICYPSLMCPQTTNTVQKKALKCTLRSQICRKFPSQPNQTVMQCHVLNKTKTKHTYVYTRTPQPQPHKMTHTPDTSTKNPSPF
jgi:hypothetical protein